MSTMTTWAVEVKASTTGKWEFYSHRKSLKGAKQAYREALSIYVTDTVRLVEITISLVKERGPRKGQTEIICSAAQ
jgi:hypothetical protein